MARKTGPANLPEDTSPRIRALIEHSAADPNRPKLPDEVEKRLDRIERESAACYADMENETFLIHRLAEKLKSDA